MNRDHNTDSIREVVGIFFDSEKLGEAITELKSSGFNNEELGLLADELTVKEKLGHVYANINKDEADPHAPNTAFVAKDAIGDVPHALFGTLYIVAAAVAGGAVVASAGILGGALAVAVATTAVFGGVGAVLAGILNKSDAEYLEEQIDEGHLLLFVRAENRQKEQKAVEIMSNHSAFDARVHEVPRLATQSG